MNSQNNSIGIYRSSFLSLFQCEESWLSLEVNSNTPGSQLGIAGLNCLLPVFHEVLVLLVQSDPVVKVASKVYSSSVGDGFTRQQEIV